MRLVSCTARLLPTPLYFAPLRFCVARTDRFIFASRMRRRTVYAERMQALARSERVKFRRAFRSFAVAIYLIRAAPATPPQTSRSQKRVAACRRNTSRKSVFQREICKSMSRCIAAGSPPHLKFIGAIGRGGSSRLCAVWAARVFIARHARALKRALGLKFNPSGLGILNLSGSGLWRSDLVYAPRPNRIRARTIAAEIKFRAAGVIMRRYEILTLQNKTA